MFLGGNKGKWEFTRALDGVYIAKSVSRHGHVIDHVTWTNVATSKHETSPLHSQTHKIDIHVIKKKSSTPKNWLIYLKIP